MRSIHQRSLSTESLNRTITFSASGQASSSGSNVRIALASGSADSFYDCQWEDHWWNGPETRDGGGTWQNAAYDDYNYQYQWTKTWQGQGEPDVNESATNHVTGLENGSAPGGAGLMPAARVQVRLGASVQATVPRRAPVGAKPESLPQHNGHLPRLFRRGLLWH